MKPAARLLIVLLLAACAARAHAQELGRLFFSAAERAELDARRAVRAADAEAAAEAPRTRVDGYVTRSHGRPTVWINGRAHNGGLRAAAGRVALAGGAHAGLRVGETYDRRSGEVSDLVGAGTLRVERAGQAR